MSVYTIELGRAGTVELAVTIIVDNGAEWSLFERDAATLELRTLARGREETYDGALSDAAMWHARRCASYSDTMEAGGIYSEIMCRLAAHEEGGAS